MGCATPQQIDYQQQQINSLILSEAELATAYYNPNLVQSGHELNLSLSTSISNMSGSYLIQIPQFYKYEYHNPNIYAAPRLHQVICEYVSADEVFRFFGSQRSALELRTGTLLRLNKLQNYNYLAVNSFINHLLISVNLQELSLKVLDFYPNSLQCAVEESCATVRELIDKYKALPLAYAAYLLRKSTFDLYQYHLYNVNLNAINARNIAVFGPFESKFCNFYSANKRYLAHVLPYSGLGDEFMLGSLAFELLTGKPAYFYFKWPESLLLSEQFPFSSDYLEGEFAEFCQLCQEGQSMDSILYSQLIKQNIDPYLISYLGDYEQGQEAEVEDRGPWIYQFIDYFKATYEDSDDFEYFTVPNAMAELDEEFFNDRVGCCGVLMGIQ